MIGPLIFSPVLRIAKDIPDCLSGLALLPLAVPFVAASCGIRNASVAVAISEDILVFLFFVFSCERVVEYVP